MKVCLIILGIFLCSHVFASQQEPLYYVSADSSSSVDCGTQENPCDSIESALNIACGITNGSIPIIMVEAGYYPTVNLTIICDIVITSVNGSKETTIKDSFISSVNSKNVTINGFSFLDTFGSDFMGTGGSLVVSDIICQYCYEFNFAAQSWETLKIYDWFINGTHSTTFLSAFGDTIELENVHFMDFTSQGDHFIQTVGDISVFNCTFDGITATNFWHHTGDFLFASTDINGYNNSYQNFFTLNQTSSILLNDNNFKNIESFNYIVNIENMQNNVTVIFEAINLTSITADFLLAADYVQSNFLSLSIRDIVVDSSSFAIIRYPDMELNMENSAFYNIDSSPRTFISSGFGSNEHFSNINILDCSFDNIIGSFADLHYNQLTIANSTFYNIQGEVNFPFMKVTEGLLDVSYSSFSKLNAMGCLQGVDTSVTFNNVNFTDNNVYNFIVDTVNNALDQKIATMNNIISVSNTAKPYTGSSLFIFRSLKTVSIDNIFIDKNDALLGVISCYSVEFNLNRAVISSIDIINSGSLVIYSSNVTITNSTFLDCTAGENGGAIFADGSNLTLDDIIFKHNTAARDGGAIAVYNSDIQASNLQFDNNTSSNGGHIYLWSSTGQLNNCSLLYGKSTTSGGCVVIDGSSTPIFTNNTISNCVANSNGGGVVSRISSYTIFDNCIFEDNISPNSGGAMYLEDKTEVKLQNSKFYRNTASSNGGAITLAINSSAITIGCIFEDNQSSSTGGSISLLNQAIQNISNSEFLNNSANSGGAIYATHVSTASLFNCTLESNTAQASGGVILGASNSSLMLDSCILRSNSAIRGSGGAIINQDFSTLVLNSNSFLGNTAPSGGALYIISSAENSVEATSCNLNNNTAKINGGAVSSNGISRSSWYNCTFQYNQAGLQGNGGGFSAEEASFSSFGDSLFIHNYAEEGGGISITQGAFVSADNTQFTNNNASNGAGIFVSDSTLLGNLLYLNNNQASNDGGGICIEEESNIIINESMFLYNTAYSSKGGGLTLYYPINNCTISNCIFENNAALSGGGVGLVKSFHILNITQNSSKTGNGGNYTFTFNNSTFIGNIAGAGGAIHIDSLEIETPTFGNTCIMQDNYATTYGGAIWLAASNFNATILYGAEFINNSAYYGGGNIGVSLVGKSSFVEYLCEDCNYTQTTYPPNTYQNSIGIASVPSVLKFDSNKSCPDSLDMTVSNISIAVDLFDSFGTIVHGNFLEDYDTVVDLQDSAMNYTETQNITNNGSATFTPVTCGYEYSDISLNFEASIVQIPNLQIETLYCDIYLQGCPVNYTQNDDIECSTCSGCNICIQGDNIDEEGEEDWIYLISIIFVTLISISISCILLSIIIVYCAYKIKKKRDIAKMENMEIPDFSDNDTLTLEDILDDPTIPRLKWQEIKMGDAIGRGASGIVSSGIWVPLPGDEKEIALKELILGINDFDVEIIKEFISEIKYMSALKHPNIVEFLGICVSPDHTKLYLVTELMQNGSLKDVLVRKKDNLNFKMRAKFALDVAKGLSYLHQLKLIHRDIKPQNLLVNKKWVCKVADFGISRVKPTITKEMTCIGTPIYMAPEVLHKNKYSEKADIFSFGTVLYEIFTGWTPYSQPPFDTMNYSQLMFQITEKNVRPDLSCLSTSLQELIKDCWNVEPTLRPSFPEIITRLTRLKKGRIAGTQSGSMSELDFSSDLEQDKLDSEILIDDDITDEQPLLIN